MSRMVRSVEHCEHCEHDGKPAPRRGSNEGARPRRSANREGILSASSPAGRTFAFHAGQPEP